MAADNLSGHDIKEYLELVKELGISKIDKKSLKKRDELREFFDRAIPNICNREFKRLTRGLGSSIERNMVKNFKASFVMDPLSTKGSLYSDGRFHRSEWAEESEAFRCMYLGPNEHVVSAECRINPFEVKSPRVNVWARVRLSNVFDAPAHEPKFPLLRILSVEPWEWVNIEVTSISQFFGRTIASLGYSGIIYQSARMEDSEAKNICVFPKNMRDGDVIEVLDPDAVYRYLNVSTEGLTLSARE